VRAVDFSSMPTLRRPFTGPPTTIVGVVLAQLRAGADWGAIAAEYLHGEVPATPLGEAEAAYFARRARP